MARTKEVWNLDMNHANNVFVRNGKVILAVHDKNDVGRQIYVQVNCDVEDLTNVMVEKLKIAVIAAEEARIREIDNLRQRLAELEGV